MDEEEKKNLTEKIEEIRKLSNEEFIVRMTKAKQLYNQEMKKDPSYKDKFSEVDLLIVAATNEQLYSFCRHLAEINNFTETVLETSFMNYCTLRKMTAQDLKIEVPESEKGRREFFVMKQKERGIVVAEKEIPDVSREQENIFGDTAYRA